MSARSLTCPKCGKVGTITGNWESPGLASGLLMTGLNLDGCDACRAMARDNGYIAVAISSTGRIAIIEQGEGLS